MEEYNDNSILYYCGVCDCIMSFSLLRHDKAKIKAIKKNIVNNNYVESKYTLKNDLKHINELTSFIVNDTIIYLLNELKKFLEMFLVLNSISEGSI